jgi:hypothetical protein
LFGEEAIGEFREKSNSSKSKIKNNQSSIHPAAARIGGQVLLTPLRSVQAVWTSSWS